MKVTYAENWKIIKTKILEFLLKVNAREVH